MIALIGPTKIDFDLPSPEPPAVIEIALLFNDHGKDYGFSKDSPGDNDEGFMSEFECELVGNKLAELCELGKVTMRKEGKWIVYEVSSDVCLLLFFLLMRHSSPHRRQTL